MNEYLIKYKIATVAELIKPFKYSDIEFTSYQDFWESDAWVAAKKVRANNITEAYSIFKNDLIPLVEMFSVISQCAFRFQANTFFIFRLNNNPENIVFINYVRETGHTGLHFDTKEYSQIDKVVKIPNKHALIYIAEAANVSSFYPRLVMLLAAVEGLAGEVMKKGEPRTNIAELDKILGLELREKLFAKKTGLRHILVHGKVSKELHKEYDGLTDILYKKLLTYLNITYGIQFEENVVHPMRNFNDNFEGTKMFEKFLQNPILDLKLLEEEIIKIFDNHVSEFMTYVHPPPTDY